MALCHNRYSTWDGLCVHLEDLYVKPDYRQRGIGRLLIEACVKYTHGLGCKRLCWEVLDWNTNGTSKIQPLLVLFLTSIGCVVCSMVDYAKIKDQHNINALLSLHLSQQR